MKSISLGHLSSDMFVDVSDYLFDFLVLYFAQNCLVWWGMGGAE